MENAATLNQSTGLYRHENFRVEIATFDLNSV